jgi:acyl-coenzyme A thioesterase PaaI-like protein
MQPVPGTQCVQEQYAAQSICFGCGPANDKGLRVRSFIQGDTLVAQWQPAAHHQAFPGMLNGGIIGSLLDCHCNWTAAMHLMRAGSLDAPPCTVTAEYSIKLLRPTPCDQPLFLSAHVESAKEDRCTIVGSLRTREKECAQCRGMFVAVKPGHPAYHRW